MAITIATLTLKLELGLYSFAQLTQEEQAFLVQLLSPPPTGFTEEQRQHFRDWRLVVPNAQLSNIEQFNQGRSLKIAVQQLTNGTQVLPIELLTDTNQGENFNHCYQWLAGLKIRRVSMNDFPSIPSFP